MNKSVNYVLVRTQLPEEDDFDFVERFTSLKAEFEE